MDPKLTHILRAGAVALSTTLIIACGGGGGAGTPADEPGVKPPLVQNAPTITGNPPTTATAGLSYQFTPQATDSDGDSLVFTVSNKPPWAALNSASGQLAGMPGDGDVGTTTGIVISVTDGNLTASLPEFSVTVKRSGANSAPTIAGEPDKFVEVGASYSFQPAANDTDGDKLSFAATNVPVWAQLDPDTGALVGTPGQAHVGTNGAIVITVSDGQSSVDLAAFTITVLQPNRAPTLQGTPATSVAADNAYSFTPSASDADGDALVFSIENAPSWASFNTGTGSLSGSPDNNDAGVYAGIVISVSDGIDRVALEPFDITVNSENSANLEITATVPANYVWSTLNDGEPVYIDRTFTYVSIPAAYTGIDYLITANDDKSQSADDFIQFNVNQAVVVYVAYDERIMPGPGWLDDWTDTGDEWVSNHTTQRVLAKDFGAGTVILGGNRLGVSTYNIGVVAAAGTPLGASDDAAQTLEDTPVSIAILNNDTGLGDAPLQVSIDVTATNGTATVTEFQTIYYEPDTGFVGGDSFSYRVTDASGDSVTATVTVTVTAAEDNSVPVTINDSYEMLQNDVLIMNVLDNDTGLFDGPVTVSIETSTDHGSVNVVSDNAIEFRPETGYTGDDALTYRVTDADGDFDTGLVAVTILPVNQAPTISGTPATSIVAGNNYQFTPAAADANGDALTFGIQNKPLWATFNSNNGELTGVPANADAGTTSGIVISVSDGEESAALASFAITVQQSANGAAFVSWTPPTTSADGSALNDLAGYRIYYGTSPGSYSSQVELLNPGLSSFTVSNLTTGTYYFVTTAFDTSNNESGYSNEASKTIP